MRNRFLTYNWWLCNWRFVFRPICWFRKDHKWENLGLFRQECAICWKRRTWKLYSDGRGTWG